LPRSPESVANAVQAPKWINVRRSMRYPPNGPRDEDKRLLLARGLRALGSQHGSRLLIISYDDHIIEENAINRSQRRSAAFRRGGRQAVVNSSRERGYADSSGDRGGRRNRRAIA